MAYFTKDKDTILRSVLRKLEQTTPIQATSPGSIARAMAEAITSEIGDLYNIIDFNLSLNVLSTAQGRALDLLGSLYSITRKSLSSVATIGKEIGAFYFYMDQPNPTQFLIPQGTLVSTDRNDVIGSTFTYTTTEDVVFPVGRTRVYASIRPAFADSVFTAGVGTLKNHNFVVSVPGVTLKCTNPKSIATQVGFEDDDSYRTRIIAAVRTAAGGTTDACRMAALSIPGVRDAVVRPAPYGLGSFETLIVVEDPASAVVIMNNVNDEMNKVRPVGVRLFLRQPDPVVFDFGATIVIQQASTVNSDALARRAETAVLRYINSLSVSSTLVYNQFIQAIMDSTPEAVMDVIVSRFAMNGEEVLRKNFAPKISEQILPGYISVSVAT